MEVRKILESPSPHLPSKVLIDRIASGSLMLQLQGETLRFFYRVRKFGDRKF